MSFTHKMRIAFAGRTIYPSNQRGVVVQILAHVRRPLWSCFMVELACFVKSCGFLNPCRHMATTAVNGLMVVMDAFSCSIV